MSDDKKGAIEFPDEFPEELKKLLGSIPDKISEALGQDVDVEIMSGSEASLLASVVTHSNPHDVVAAVVAMVGGFAWEHVTHPPHEGCTCTPDYAWEQSFGYLNEVIEKAKATLYPKYIEEVERDLFEIEVSKGLEDLEVAEPDRPDKQIALPLDTLFPGDDTTPPAAA